MGVEKAIISQGDGTTYPKSGDLVAIEYTGWLYDPSAENKKGQRFDSSTDRRADFVTQIGVGQVIKGTTDHQGWDEGVLTMSVGEKATLTITSDFAYGDRGFPGHIPPGATLVFDVELKRIQ